MEKEKCKRCKCWRLKKDFYGMRKFKTCIKCRTKGKTIKIPTITVTIPLYHIYEKDEDMVDDWDSMDIEVTEV